MSSPTPVQSFLGGVALALPVHSLLLLNGSVLGISGFLHRAVRGDPEAFFSVAAFLAAGVVIGLVEGPVAPAAQSLQRIALSGLLVGVGTKVRRVFPRRDAFSDDARSWGRAARLGESLVATATFFSTAVLTARFAYTDPAPPIAAADWTLGAHGATLLALQAIPLALSACLYFLNPPPADAAAKPAPPSPLRRLAAAAASAHFALALRLSNLTQPARVAAFLRPGRAWDPSLACLALGALPLATALYQRARGPEAPRLGGAWGVPRGRVVDGRLVGGAVVFGVGWGLGGICRASTKLRSALTMADWFRISAGPGLVNLGASLATGVGITEMGTWVSAVVLGGLFV
ncbi:hypothetical protein HWV62_15215 [Athelia sp. TMB]|nr:hypothetical protein HWV62_15215 [Athelia sp. TMB]